MEQFRKVSSNIVRCTYTPDGNIDQSSWLVDPSMLTGNICEDCPIAVEGVSFMPRRVERLEPDGNPVIRVEKTVDGQRTRIDNLKSVFERMAWRAEIRIRFWEDEGIYGLGQDEDGVWNLHGRIEYLYQHNMRIPIPMFISSKGYGVFFDCACLMVFDDREEPCRITLECVDQVDFYVITGKLDEIIAGYRMLTGRAAAMPEWVFGYWQSKERYQSQNELVQVAERFKADRVPLDVIVQDWKTWKDDLWGDKHPDPERYPDLKEANDRLHAMGVHSIVSIWPNMNAGGCDHEEFAAKKLLLGDYSTYDAFNQEARKIYWRQAAEELYAGGFDGWWCDNTEPFSSPDWCGEKKKEEAERYRLVGTEHEEYLGPFKANAYALFHAKGIFENQPNKPVVNLTRSGWAGIQKYGVILWAGDTSASWEELRHEITKGLRISLSGIPYWTVDTGAFFVGGTACWRKWKDDPEAAPVWFWHGEYDSGVRDAGYQELYTRWLQFSCFLPIFRSHGTDTPREYWNFDEPFRSAIIETIRLRYRLMPYIQNMARRVTKENFTMLRCLAFDFPDDPYAWSIDDEFMFGNELLICPITEPFLYEAGNKPLKTVRNHRGGPTKICYLPEGTDWTDYFTGTRYTGGQRIEIPVCIEHVPVFQRIFMF